MGQRGWVARTGQRWKLMVGAVLLSVGGSAIIAMMAVTGSTREVFGSWDRSDLIVVIAFALVVGGAGSMLWLLITIRCPRCGSRPVWALANRRGSSQWSAQLLSLEACPTCHFDAAEDDD